MANAVIEAELLYRQSTAPIMGVCLRRSYGLFRSLLEGGYKISASNGVEGMRLKGAYHGGDGVYGVGIFGIALDGGTRDFALVRQLYGCLSSSVLDAMFGASLIGRSLLLVAVLSIAWVYRTYFSGCSKSLTIMLCRISCASA